MTCGSRACDGSLRAGLRTSTPARPFDSEIRACELEDAEEGSELETALDAFMRSSGPERRREAVRVAAQIIEGLAAEITA